MPRMICTPITRLNLSLAWCALLLSCLFLSIFGILTARAEDNIAKSQTCEGFAEGTECLASQLGCCFDTVSLQCSGYRIVENQCKSKRNEAACLNQNVNCAWRSQRCLFLNQRNMVCSETAQPKWKQLSRGPFARVKRILRRTLQTTKSPTISPSSSSWPLSKTPSSTPTISRRIALRYLGFTKYPTKKQTPSPSSPIPSTAPSTAPSTSPQALVAPSRSPISTPESKSPSKKRTPSPTKFPIRKQRKNKKKRPVPTVAATKIPSATNSPTETSSPTILGWSSELDAAESSFEFNSTVPCRLFKDDVTCRHRNFCCWDEDASVCYAPVEHDENLECPLVNDEHACGIVYSKSCIWENDRCQRRMPHLTFERTPDWICKSTLMARQASERHHPKREYCFVKVLNKPCVFPLVVKGVSYSGCVPVEDLAPPATKSNEGDSMTRKSWCAVIPKFDPNNNKAMGFANKSNWGYCTCRSNSVRERPKSIVMIVVDDMRPALRAAYGTADAQTPILDEFVSNPSTVVFDRAFTQYALCAPSRNLLFSSLSPFTTKQFNFAGNGLKSNATLRSMIQTLPQHLKQQGFFTTAGGKVFHNGHDDPLSWSTQDPFAPNLEQNSGCAEDPLARNIVIGPAGKRIIVRLACVTTAGINSLPDFKVANNAGNALQRIVHSGQEPFMLVAGFYKPHTPYHVHNKFWQRFSPIATQVADITRAQGPEPVSSYNVSLTFDTDSGVFDYWGANPYEQKNGELRRVLRAGYLAAVSQTDEAIGRILTKLKELALEETTMVVVIGDNGYFLGENNIISKHNNFDLATRVPLLMRIPWIKPVMNTDVAGGNQSKTTAAAFTQQQRLASWVVPPSRRISEFVELLDVFPTVVSLLELPRYTGPTEGKDQSGVVITQLMHGNTEALPRFPRNDAFSQVSRCFGGNCQNAPMSSIANVGYSIRTMDWRLTAFFSAPAAVVEDWTQVLSLELYDHRNDNDSLFNYDETGPRLDLVEIENVAQRFPDICQELIGRIQERYAAP